MKIFRVPTGPYRVPNIFLKKTEMQSFTVLCAKFHKFCARKLLLLTAVLIKIFVYKVFPTKLRSHELFGS